MQPNAKGDDIDKVILQAGLVSLFLFCSMIFVYILIGKWSLAVVFGGLIGLAAALINLLLLGQAVRMSVEMSDQTLAAAKMRSSYTGRTLGLVAAGAASFLIPGVDGIACLIAMLFPKAGIALIQAFRAWKNKKN